MTTNFVEAIRQVIGPAPVGKEWLEYCIAGIILILGIWTLIKIVGWLMKI